MGLSPGGSANEIAIFKSNFIICYYMIDVTVQISLANTLATTFDKTL